MTQLGRTGNRWLPWLQISFCLVFFACSVAPQIPILVDERVHEIIRNDAARIVAVSEDRGNFSKYQFFLSDFPRKDILGLSIGNGRIYISYDLASRALTDPNHRWLLRLIVAHEIAHETADHANQPRGMSSNAGTFAAGFSGADIGLPWYVSYQNYPTEKELEADLKGLGYWNRLDWDCQIWVRILEFFQKQNYTGGVSHPTDKRLKQAQNVCAPRREEKSPERNPPDA